MTIRLFLLLSISVIASCDRHEPEYKPASTSIEDPFAKVMMNPNWKRLEERFGVPMPAELKAFYGDPAKVLQENFDIKTVKSIERDYRVHVETFTPIGEADDVPIPGNESFLQIASDGGGGAYQFDPKESAPEVIYHFVDGDDSYPTGLSLSQFLNAPRLKPEELE